MRKTPTYYPMTQLERRAARAIEPGAVTYPVASFDKRFARSMASQSLNGDDAMITNAQRRLLWTKVIRYRRQLSRDDQDLIAIAEAEIKRIDEQCTQDNPNNEPPRGPMP